MNSKRSPICLSKKIVLLLCASIFFGSSWIATDAHATNLGSNLTQCANDANNDGIIEPCTWVTGALTTSNSDYAESDGVPQRWFFEHQSGLATEAHTAVFQYTFTKNSIYSYDFLVNVDHTMPMSLINPCGNLPPFVDPTDCINAFTAAINVPIPADPFDAVSSREHPPIRNVQFGCIEESTTNTPCTLVSVGTPVHVPNTNCFQNCGDTDVQITVNFTTPGTVVPAKHLISLYVSGQLASAADPDGAGPAIGWGAGFGASSAPGASYHFKLVSLDGAHVGGEDDQINSNLVEQSHNADLSVTKTCPPTVVKGNNVSYTITATNNGPQTATNVFIDDVLPAGTTFVSATPSLGTCNAPSGGILHCDIGFMQPTPLPGSTVTITIVVTVPSGFVGSSIRDDVMVGGAVIDPVPANNTASCTTSLTNPTPPVDLSVTKTDSPDPVIAGNNLTYTLTVTNNSPTPASGVILTDSLPGGLLLPPVSVTPSLGSCGVSANVVTCNLGGLSAAPGPGNQATVTIVVTVDPATRGTITNVATVTGNETDDNLGNNTASEPTQVNGQMDVSVSKTCNPASITAGDTVTFHITASNAGPSSALDVHLEDIITPSAGVTYTFISATPSQGSGCSFNGVDTAHCVLGNIAPGGSATVDIIVLINSGSSGSISDAAQTHIHAPDEDTNHCNDQPPIFGTCPLPDQGCTACLCATTVTGTPPVTVDLSVAKSAPPTVVAGDNLTYSITAKNLSTTNDGHNVMLTDTLPGNVAFVSSNPGGPTCTESLGVVTCNLGTISACIDPPGCNANSVTVMITITVDQLFEGTLTNLVTVQGDEPDPDTANNSASVDTTASLPTPPVPVPTISEWGLILFMIFAGLWSIYYLRRQKET